MSALATRRREEQLQLGLSRRDWYLFKVHEWVRLYGVVPSALDWNVAMARASVLPERLELVLSRHEDAVWPNASSVAIEFGRWSAVLEVAGLPALRPGFRQDSAPPIPEPAPVVLEQLERLWRDDELWASGGALQEIADRLDLNPGVVLSYSRRLSGLPERVLVEAVEAPLSQRELIRLRRAQVAALWQLDMPTSTIAERLGVSPQTVSQDAARLRRDGVPLPRRGRTRRARSLSPDQLAVAQRLRFEGWEVDRIAALFAVPVSRVQRSLSEPVLS